MAKSALDLLPEYIRVRITTGKYPDDYRPDGRIPHNSIRPDLALIPLAEAGGWTVEFRNDHWHNSAQFTRGVVSVWYHGPYWRAADLVLGRYTNHRTYRDLASALSGEVD